MFLTKFPALKRSYVNSFHTISQIFLINEIGDLRFLSGAISQKRTEIVDFTDFYETFWSECRERNERSPKRRPGSPLGWPKRRMKRPAANEVNEMSGENVSAKWKNISDITKDFRDITKLKKLTSAILDDMHF